jgi:outer membrane protein assembly factor BamB
VTDGQHVYAFFGSRGLYCLDMSGELKWKSDLGKMNTKHGHGEGSSPVLHGNTLVVNWDHERESFVVAFDKRTGAQLWKVTRDELTSWATPIVVENGGKPQLIVSGTKRIRGYELSSGKLVWECGGMSANVVASPVADESMVYAGSSYEKRKIMGIRYEGATGDLTGTDQVVWESVQGTPYVPSPLLYAGALYFLAHYQGVLSRVEARTGKLQPGRLRLEDLRNIYASPIGADGRIYITDLDGSTLVISNDESPKLLAFNRLDDSFSASAAAVGSELFLRGRKFLYCISEGGTDGGK